MFEEILTKEATAEARHVLALARQIAKELKHAYICPEHILLAIIQSEDKQAFAIFNGLLVDTNKLRQAIMHDFTVVTASKEGSVNFTPRCNKIFAFAIAAGRSSRTKINTAKVTTAHVMLGIIHEGSSRPATVFQELKVNEKAIEQEILLENVIGNQNLEAVGEWKKA